MSSGGWQVQQALQAAERNISGELDAVTAGLGFAAVKTVMLAVLVAAGATAAEAAAGCLARITIFLASWRHCYPARCGCGSDASSSGGFTLGLWTLPLFSIMLIGATRCP